MNDWLGNILVTDEPRCFPVLNHVEASSGIVGRRASSDGPLAGKSLVGSKAVPLAIGEVRAGFASIGGWQRAKGPRNLCGAMEAPVAGARNALLLRRRRRGLVRLHNREVGIMRAGYASRTNKSREKVAHVA